MAWYVESLIIDRERIRSKATDGSIVVDTDRNTKVDIPDSIHIINKNSEYNYGDYDKFNVSIYMDNDLDNSLFNDLLLVEKAIGVLYGTLELDENDLEVLQVISVGGSLVDMAQQKNIDVNMLIKYFFTSCNKLSYELQGHFTDAGYIKYMCKKHRLNEQQTNKMVKYMQKSRRTRIRRLINDKATY